MTLVFETEYTDKKGTKVQLKTPKMKVIGKDMDNTERHEFQVLTEDIKEYKHTCVVDGKQKEIVTHQMFVKYPGQLSKPTGSDCSPTLQQVGQDDAFNIDLSQQAYNAISALKPKKGDRLIITKGMREIKKTGAIMPIIIAELVPGENHNSGQNASGTTKPAANIGFNDEIDFNLSEQYRSGVKASEWSLNHFIGTYLRTMLGYKDIMLDKRLMDRIEWLWNNKVNPNTDKK